MKQKWELYDENIIFSIRDKDFLIWIISNNEDNTFKITAHSIDFSKSENNIDTAVDIAKKFTNLTKPIMQGKDKKIFIDYFNDLINKSNEKVDLTFEYFYQEYDNCLISVQREQSFKKFQKNSKISFNNLMKYESYEWLHKLIGFYPMWTMLIDNNRSLNDIDYNINVRDGRYVFIIKPEEDDFYTDFYNWCDIHYLINDSSEEEYEKDKHLLKDVSHISKIQKDSTIQVLKKEFNKSNIKAIYEIVDLKAKKFKLIYGN